MLCWNNCDTAHKLGARFCSREENCAKFEQCMSHFRAFERSVSMKRKAFFFIPVLACYSLAVAGNKMATQPLCRPFPRWGAEENRKKQAETGGSG